MHNYACSVFVVIAFCLVCHLFCSNYCPLNYETRVRHFCDTLPFFHSRKSSNRHLNLGVFSASLHQSSIFYTLHLLMIMDSYQLLWFWLYFKMLLQEMMLERWNWNLQFLIKFIWPSYVQTLCVVAHVTRLCTKVLSNVLMLERSRLPSSPPHTHTPTTPPTPTHPH